MEVSIRQISRLEEMERVEDSWNKFISEHSQSPFLFSGFSNQFFKPSYENDVVPTCLIISVEKRIVGVSPVGIIDKGFFRFGTFLPGIDLQPDLVCESKYRELCLKQTVDFLFRKLRCQFVDLSFQARSPNLNVLKHVCRQLRIPFSMTPSSGHSILQVKEAWADFERSRGRNYRKLIRRIERRLNAAGSWRISLYGREDDESRVFDRILEIERTSWKQPQWKRMGLSIDPGLTFFWNGSRQTALKEIEFDWKVAILELDGKGVAYSLFVKFKQSAYICKTSFDERYRKEYLGIYVNDAVVRELFGRSGVKEIDFMTDLPFHRKWTDQPTPLVMFTMSQRSLVLILVRHSPFSRFFRVGFGVLKRYGLFW